MIRITMIIIMSYKNLSNMTNRCTDSHLKTFMLMQAALKVTMKTTAMMKMMKPKSKKLNSINENCLPQLQPSYRRGMAYIGQH